MNSELIEKAIDSICEKYLNDERVYIKIVAGIAYRAGVAAGEGRLAESESEKAHLISAMKDCWTEMMRAKKALENQELNYPTLESSDPHLNDWI
jgi:hypothetical protein